MHVHDIYLCVCVFLCCLVLCIVLQTRQGSGSRIKMVRYTKSVISSTTLCLCSLFIVRFGQIQLKMWKIQFAILTNAFCYPFFIFLKICWDIPCQVSPTIVTISAVFEAFKERIILRHRMYWAAYLYIEWNVSNRYVCLLVKCTYKTCTSLQQWIYLLVSV